MKRNILIFLLIAFISPFLMGATYEFTVDELNAFVKEVVTKVYDEKDLEISNLITEHDLIMVDKDLEISGLLVSEELLSGEVLKLAKKNQKYEKILQWSPVVIITTLLTGVITGLFLSDSF